MGAFKRWWKEHEAERNAAETAQLQQRVSRLLKKGRNTQAAAEAKAVMVAHQEGPHTDQPYRAAWSLYAAVLVGLGRHTEAEEELAHQSGVFTAALAPEHAAVLVTRSNRSANLGYLGRYDEAEAEAQAVLSLAHLVPKPARVQLELGARSGLIHALNNLHRFPEAEQQARSALDLTRFAAPIFAFYLRLGLARSLNGQRHYDEALQTAAKATGVLPGDTATLRLITANARLGLGRLAEAEADVREALAVCEWALSPTHHVALENGTLLGRVLAAQGRHTEAEEQLRATLAAWTEHFGADHPKTRAAAQALTEQTDTTPGQPAGTARPASGRPDASDADPDADPDTADRQDV